MHGRGHPEGIISASTRPTPQAAWHGRKADGPEGSVLPLESPFIFGEKPVELVEQHPIERLFPFFLHSLK